MHKPGWPRCLCNSSKLCFGVDNVHRKQNQNQHPVSEFLLALNPNIFSSPPPHLI